MQIKKLNNILIFSNGSLFINRNQTFYRSKTFLFYEKDSSNFFLNKRKDENSLKTSELYLNYKNKYFKY